MLDSINHITIDVSDPLNTPVVKAVQEDIRSRYVEIILVSNGEPLTIPSAVDGMVGIRRPNGTYVLYDEDDDGNAAVTFDNNVATVYLTQEALAVAGALYTSVSIYTSTARLTAFHFIVDVEPTAVPSDVVVESDYFNILEGLVADAIDAAQRAEDAAASVQNPVSYSAQTPTSAEQAQARQNIGIVSASTSAEGIVQLYNGVDSTSTTVAATAAAVKEAYDRIVLGENLLDNWCFDLPINQRGQSTYSGVGYGIDRWKCNTAGLSVTNADGHYLKLQSTASISAGSRLFYQQIENPSLYAGKTLTYSILTYDNCESDVYGVLRYISDDTVYTPTFTIPASDGRNVYSVTATLPSTVTDLMVTIQSPTDSGMESGKEIRLLAAKLELGNKQTLAYYDNSAWNLTELPNRAEQLRRCGRFFYKADSEMYTNAVNRAGENKFYITIQHGFAKDPTISFSGNTYYFDSSGIHIVSITSATAKKTTEDYCTFEAVPALGGTWSGGTINIGTATFSADL